jgi:hypothetical protein
VVTIELVRECSVRYELRLLKKFLRSSPVCVLCEVLAETEEAVENCTVLCYCATCSDLLSMFWDN